MLPTLCRGWISGASSPWFTPCTASAAPRSVDRGGARVDAVASHPLQHRSVGYDLALAPITYLLQHARMF